MFRFLGVLVVSLAVQSTVVSAQSISGCEQTIQYNLQPPGSDVPAELKGFSGVWTGSWANQLCHILIVESIANDGTVQTKYAWGTNPNWGMSKPGINPWSGKIVQGVLTLRNNNVTVEYRLKGGTELAGTYTRGAQYPGTFKRQ